MARLDARFAVNLRGETARAEFRSKLRPWGYLVPPSGLTATLANTARTLRAGGRGLVIDNGQFDDIGRIAAEVGIEASAVSAALAGERARLGRAPRRSELSALLRQRIDGLARSVELGAATAHPMLLADQLALNPTAVIGVEDVAPTTWLRVGLDSPLLANARVRVRRRNTAVATAAVVATAEARRLAPATSYYPVASAFDYDTAFDAGHAFAAAGLRCAAMGFGAFMADDGYARSILVRGRNVSLPTAMPLRYLRSALVARGFWDGWKAASGGAPREFHFLGLGAPIMVGIVAMAAASTRTLTFDATSPIRDAAEGTLYFAQPTYLKVRTRRAALRLAAGEWTRWTCTCPFCRAFVAAHPFDYAAGRAWVAGRGAGAGADASGADLAATGALASAYPLLSEPAPGPLRTEVNFARAGHNHWVLQRILADLGRHSDTRRSLEAHVADVVDTYGRATSSDSYGAAVRTAFDIARGAAVVPA